MSIELPVKKSEIDLRFSKQKLGLIGAAGIGKSTFFAQEENALFIEAEKGLNYLSVYKMPVKCWEDLRQVYSVLRKAKEEGKFPYTIIVFDTFDRIVDFAEEEIISRAREFYTKIANEINTIGDVPNGAGWSKTRQLIGGFLVKMEELDCALAYVGHVQTRRLKEGVREYNKHTISLWAGLAEDLVAWPDHLLHVGATYMGDKLKRTVFTRPTQSIEAKSRGGIVPDGWQWEEDMKVNWDIFRKLFK